MYVFSREEILIKKKIKGFHKTKMVKLTLKVLMNSAKLSYYTNGAASKTGTNQ